MIGSDFEIEGVVYRCRRLSAAVQFGLYRRISPNLSTLIGADAGLRRSGLTAAMMADILAPLRDLPDADTDAIFSDVRSAVERIDGEAIGHLALSTLMSLTAEVVRHNFSGLFAMARPSFEPCHRGANDKGFGELGPVPMPDDSDWLDAPMMAGLCRYADLRDGTLQIEDVAYMNDRLAVKAENEARLRYAADQG